MRMISTLAVGLGLLVLTANVGSAQIVTIDKINLGSPPPANIESVQPEGKASVGMVPGQWEVKVMFGTISGGVFTAFNNTPITVIGIQQPTVNPGQVWRVPAPIFTAANWVAPYYCKALLTETINTVTTIKSTTHMQVK